MFKVPQGKLIEKGISLGLKVDSETSLRMKFEQEELYGGGIGVGALHVEDDELCVVIFVTVF